MDPSDLPHPEHYDQTRTKSNSIRCGGYDSRQQISRFQHPTTMGQVGGSLLQNITTRSNRWGTQNPQDLAISHYIFAVFSILPSLSTISHMLPMLTNFPATYAEPNPSNLQHFVGQRQVSPPNQFKLGTNPTREHPVP